jgi:hypothetical protein
MTPRIRGVGVLVGLAAMSLLVRAPLAEATEAQPFEVAKFSMQTTAQTKIVAGPSDSYEFINEPYSFTQAGGHPWALTTTVEFPSEEVFEESHKEFFLVSRRDPKDIVVDLPPGLLGDPVAVPRCPLAEAFESKCPPSTQVGVYRLMWLGGKEYIGPIVNVVPEMGQSAEFTLENEVKINPILTAHLVRTEGGYGFTVVSNAIPPVELIRVETTFWGVPADPSHDPMRGLYCGSVQWKSQITCKPGSGNTSSEVAPVPFLSMPTDCSVGPEMATVRTDSWQEPGRVLENQKYQGYANAGWQMPGVTGCDRLAFNPEIEVGQDTKLADEPVALGVNIKVPQPETPERLATPHLRKAVVTLPLGMSISPGVVDGIRACEGSGPEGINITGPESEEVGLNGELQLAPGHCPDASIVGTAEATTPLLPVPVRGHVYLAKPGCGGAARLPCTEEDALDGNLYQLYLELGGTGEFADVGIQIKVGGKTEVDPATGQITSVFEENPQTPFSELKIHLNGGPRAPIDNPAVCGPAVTTSDFTPWSAPGLTPEGLAMAGTPDATPSSFYDVEGCSSPPPLNPGLIAGTVTPNAGKFSSFTLNLSRKDREQFIKGIQVHTPPGLLGVLSNVPLCGQPQAEDPAAYGECPQASKIGTTRVASGAGSHPFEIEGSIYLTEAYDGAPFGLSIVTHAVAGPFNLGLVVVRARIDVDPENSTLTVTTDETGPHAVPQIVFGVPLRLQRVTVNIDRPDFMFNPTNCKAQRIDAAISGSQNATADVSVPFAVGNCRSLAFKPNFSVATNGQTSRAKGASLYVKLSYPTGAMGNDANIARVKVLLPKQLPSYLPTLQKACLAATFNVNPVACPPGSIVGIAKATTPILPVGLSGPVYFVSHGGEEFPSLIIVLQGYGVRVDLVGSTFIKKGITSSTFKTIPDVPVNTFELYLPQGKDHALAANGNLCATTRAVRRTITQRVNGRIIHKRITPQQNTDLVMPTEFVAQNGASVKQNTPITVTNCNATATTRHRTSAKRTTVLSHDSNTNGRSAR